MNRPKKEEEEKKKQQTMITKPNPDTKEKKLQVLSIWGNQSSPEINPIRPLLRAQPRLPERHNRPRF